MLNVCRNKRNSIGGKKIGVGNKCQKYARINIFTSFLIIWFDMLNSISRHVSFFIFLGFWEFEETCMLSFKSNNSECQLHRFIGFSVKE